MGLTLQVIVIGCSGGGPYAAGFAALYPARTETLGLVAPLAPTDWRHKEHRKVSVSQCVRTGGAAARGCSSWGGQEPGARAAPHEWGRLDMCGAALRPAL